MYSKILGLIFIILSFTNLKALNNYNDSVINDIWYKINFDTPSENKALIDSLYDLTYDVDDSFEKLKIYQSVLFILKLDSSNNEEIIQAHHLIAAFSIASGDLILGFKHYLNALEIANKMGSSELIANCNFYYGHSLFINSNKELGIEELNKSLSFYKKDSLSYLYELNTIYSVLGEFELQNNNPTKALNYYNKVYHNACNYIKDSSDMYNAYQLYFKFLILNFKDSTNKIEEVYARIKNIGRIDEDFAAKANEKMIDIYYKLRISKDLSVINEIKDFEIFSSSYASIAEKVFWFYKEYYLLTNNTEQAYIYLEKMYLAKNKKNSYKASNLKLQEDMEFIESSLENIKREKSVLKENIKTNNRTILTLTISIILLILVMILVIKNTRLKKKLLNKKLEYKNKELVSSNLLIAERQRNLERINSIVNSNTNEKEIIEELKKSSYKNFITNDDWENFTKHFNDVHTNFYKKLIKNYPELTKNELKLCGLIKMNLSTKEIAQLLNINPESVQKSRYRIRKKMNLSKEENLDIYIQNI